MSSFLPKKLIARIDRWVRTFGTWAKTLHTVQGSSVASTKRTTKRWSVASFEQTLLSIPPKKKEYTTPTYIAFGTKGAWMFWIVGALVIFASYALYTAQSMVFVVITWLILSIAMESGISFLARFMPRGWSISLAYVLFIVFLLLWFVLIVLIIPSQISLIIDFTVQQIKDLQLFFQTHTLVDVVTPWTWLPNFIYTWLVAQAQHTDVVAVIQSTIQTNLDKFITAAQGSGSRVVVTIKDVVATIADIIFKTCLVLVLAVTCSLEKDKVAWFLARLGGKIDTPYRAAKIQVLYRKMWSWLQGQLFLCVLIWIITRAGLTLLELFGVDIPNTASLALIAGLTEFIPYIWPILGAIPALLVATTSNGLVWFILVFILFFVIQQTENNLLVPWVMKKQLGVSPTVIFISMLLGGVALWFLGVLLAVPFAVIVTLLFDEDFK